MASAVMARARPLLPTAVVVLVHGAVLALALAAPVAVTPPELPVLQVLMLAEPIPVEPVSSPPPELPPPALPPPERALETLPPSEPAPALPPAPPAPEPPAPEPPAPEPPAPEPRVTPPQVNAAHGAAPPIVYPAMSRRLGETGTVLLHLHVLADGRIGAVNVLRSSGFPRLDRAAADAALRWRLTPARRGEEPVAMWYRWPVQFELE